MNFCSQVTWGKYTECWGFSCGSVVKNPTSVQEAREAQEMRVRSLGVENPLKEGMVTHSSVLAWRIPTDRAAWWATIHRVGKSLTRLSNLAHTHAYRMLHFGVLSFYSLFSYS